MTDFITNFDYSILVYLWPIIIISAIFRSFTGFGFALAAVPAFSVFLSPIDAVVLVSLLTLLINVLFMKNYIHEVPVKPLIPLLFMAFVGTMIGVEIIKVISKDLFQFLVGISVIFACLSMILFKSKKIVEKPRLAWVVGLFSGVMNGTLALPGPPVIIYALNTQTTPEKSRSLLAAFFFISAAFALVSYFLSDFLTWDSLGYLLVSAPAMIVGDKLGFYLFSRYGGDFYRKVALVFLILIGCSMLVTVI